MTGKPFGMGRGPDGKTTRCVWGPATPRWSSSRSWRPEAERPLQVMMQSSPSMNVSLVPWSASVATTSLALATHPIQSSSIMGGARALLSLKRSWWRRTLRDPPKAQGTTAPFCPLHSNIQAAGLPQGAHALCHFYLFVWQPKTGLNQWTNGNSNSICYTCKLLASLGNFLLNQSLQGFHQSIPWVQKFPECTVWVKLFKLFNSWIIIW